MSTRVKELVHSCINKVSWKWTWTKPCIAASLEWRKHVVSEFIRRLRGSGGSGRGAKQVTQHCRLFATVYSLKQKHAAAADPSIHATLVLWIYYLRCLPKTG